jgi:hypothetical protein
MAKKNGYVFDRKMKIASAIIAFILVIIITISTVLIVNSKKSQGDENGQSSSIPANPRKSATAWLEKLMTTTSSKFGTDFFDSNSASLKQLMNGDSSFIPSNIKESIHLGDSTDDMAVSRTILDGSSYAGLIMFSNAYKQTVDKKISTTGYTLASYDASEKTVYIPAQAIMSTTQAVQFAVKWDGRTWRLQGDPLGWSVYVMLENNASTSSSSSTTK